MANPEHLAILKRGSETWNNWRKEHEAEHCEPICANLDGADLSGADLTHAYLTRGKLRNANLRDADLTYATLLRADLRGANLRNADLCGAKLIDAALRGAALRSTNLRGAALCGTHLLGTDLRGTNLAGTNLAGTNLAGTDLAGTDLADALLRGTNLAGANLVGANLVGANLAGADLRGANLTGACLGSTLLARANLARAVGLEACVHSGPSIVDHDTLTRSGQLPLVFLRGCGLPDPLIEYLPSLLAQAIPHPCFISYLAGDSTFAERLHADLQDKGVRCWFAPEDMKIGDTVRPRMDEAMRVFDKLLLILSKDSMKSDWVEKAVKEALEREKRGKTLVLFPVRLDDGVQTTDVAWAADIRRTRHIGDFGGWKDPAAYQNAFERLLRDLTTATH